MTRHLWMLAASAVAVTLLPAKLSAQDNTPWSTTGNIGIGTGGVTPAAKLDIRGSGGAGTAGDLLRWGSTNDQYYGILGYNLSAGRVFLTTRGSGSSALSFGPNGREDLHINSLGQVGVGTTAPSVVLDTRGASGDIFKWGSADNKYAGVLGYNSFTSRTYLMGRGSAASSFVIGRNDTEDLIINSIGDVGIGATPSNGFKFEVAGGGWMNGPVTSSVQGDIGGRIVLDNLSKTAHGVASSWKIYNMTGTYGNSLQFWAYDQYGCENGGLCAPRFVIMDNGNVGIGVSAPQLKLAVDGTIGARKIKVTQQADWADFVFEPNYKLPSLQDVESYIKTHGHLQDIPTTAEVQKDGVDLADMNKKLLQKVEELTLYLIDLKKEVDQLKAERSEKK